MTVRFIDKLNVAARQSDHGASSRVDLRCLHEHHGAGTQCRVVAVLGKGPHKTLSQGADAASFFVPTATSVRETIRAFLNVPNVLAAGVITDEG